MCFCVLRQLICYRGLTSAKIHPVGLGIRLLWLYLCETILYARLVFMRSAAGTDKPRIKLFATQTMDEVNARLGNMAVTFGSLLPGKNA